ncbi:MAG: poly-beta-1,6-N-acetyl-D-glucosamine biosynthesis protein PgaD [Gammaproteobacteria bacterium]
MSELVIHRPDLQTLRQRYGYGMATLVLWLAYIYLWVPLATLGAWGLEVGFIHRQLTTLRNVEGLYRLLAVYAVVVLAIGTALIAWARLNLKRFRGMDRRKAPLPVTTREVASAFHISPSVLSFWYLSKSITMQHSANGQVLAPPDTDRAILEVARLFRTVAPSNDAPTPAEDRGGRIAPQSG